MRWPNGSQSKPYVSSAFGPRNIPVLGASKNHKGTDFSHTFSTIRAVAAGQVKVAGTPNGWGNGGTQVWVQHDGFFSRSLHASSLLVKAGQFVREGDPLAVMGRTGTASDVHLHLEITPGTVHYSNTGQVDPVTFISNRIGSPAAGGTDTPASRGGDTEEDEMTAQEIEELKGWMTEMTSQQITRVTDARLKRIEESVVRYPAPGVVQYRIDDLATQIGWILAAVKQLPGGADVDEEQLAAALAPRLAAHLPQHTQTLSDADLARMATAVADEQARRLAS